MDDELERDMELAQQIAFAPPSPKCSDAAMVCAEPSGSPSGMTPASEDNISSLTSLQTRSTFYKVENGLMTLLRRCLESESGSPISIITGHIDHYQSLQSEDSGWGCGWRNIQMLSSHLLMQSQEARDALFGGCRFVPDIPSLQRWLEIAWYRGFDSEGSESFNNKIYGSKKWIGTTECAALLRSFGLRARVVDFDGLLTLSSTLSHVSRGSKGRKTNSGQARSKRKSQCAYGPLDKYFYRSKPNATHVGSSFCEKSQEAHHGSTSTHPDSCSENNENVNSHHVLVDWIWNYFNGDTCSTISDSKHVLLSKRTPLYFQHDGHSRTIVGIQKQKGQKGVQYVLLVFDPSQRTVDMERSLTAGKGWQRLIKRGVCTLRKPQYQLCYVDPGIAYGTEMEQLKIVQSVLLQCPQHKHVT